MLLGSIASPKYVDVLGRIFGERLLFPIDFVGRGDMSRGGLLLRQAARRRRARVRRRSPAPCSTARGRRSCPPLPQDCAHAGGRRLDARHGLSVPNVASASCDPIVNRVSRSPAIRTTSSLTVDGKEVRLTNLRKIFWPELGLTKGDLLQYYADVAGVLLPHLRDRAMVMKRYPHGAAGEFFFMKRAPSPRPPWIEICPIDHGSRQRHRLSDDPGSRRAAVGDQPRLHRPEPVVRALRRRRSAGLPALRSRSRRRRHVRAVLETALVVHEALDTLKMPSVVKTTGSKGLHVYVPIVRGPEQKQVWTFAKALAQELAVRHPALMTAEYRVAKRPRGRVLVDYNQNAWGSTLASIYSVRPRPEATVSTPVTWKEVDKGVRDRGLHDQERAGARREARRSLEAAARRARPLQPVAIRLRSAGSDAAAPLDPRRALRVRASIRRAGRSHSPGVHRDGGRHDGARRHRRARRAAGGEASERPVHPRRRSRIRRPELLRPSGLQDAGARCASRSRASSS